MRRRSSCAKDDWTRVRIHSLRPSELIRFLEWTGIMRMNLLWLSDEQWARIEPQLPTDVHDRRVIGKIVLKIGCRWSDCPPEYGPMRRSTAAWHVGRRADSGKACSANMLEADTQPTRNDRVDARRGARLARGRKRGARNGLLGARAAGATRRRSTHSQMIAASQSASWLELNQPNTCLATMPAVTNCAMNRSNMEPSQLFPTAAGPEAPEKNVFNHAFDMGQSGHNYHIREIAGVMSDVVSGRRLELAPDAGRDTRSYRLTFEKIVRLLQGFKPQWDVRRRAEQLYVACRSSGLTFQECKGARYQLIAHVKKFLAEGIARQRSAPCEPANRTECLVASAPL
jgi:hypothetical protein